MTRSLLRLVCVCLIVCCKLSLSAQLVPEKLPVLLINEVHNEDYLNDDVFIELVVVKTDEIAHNPADSTAKIIIDDANTGPGMEPGFLAIDPKVFRFSKPGDIVVVKGSSMDLSLIHISEPTRPY